MSGARWLHRQCIKKEIRYVTISLKVLIGSPFAGVTGTWFSIDGMKNFIVPLWSEMWNFFKKFHHKRAVSSNSLKIKQLKRWKIVQEFCVVGREFGYLFYLWENLVMCSFLTRVDCFPFLFYIKADWSSSLCMVLLLWFFTGSGNIFRVIMWKNKRVAGQMAFGID